MLVNGWQPSSIRPIAVPVGGRYGRAGVMIGPSFPHVLVPAQGGDEQSFEMLWQDLHPQLLGYLQVLAPAGART